MIERDIPAGDRSLHVYDAGPEHAAVTVVWHHGTPNIGAPPEPLLADAARLGVRFVGYDRPGYGGSTPDPGRRVASAATDSIAVADALRIGRFAVMGHSGGGPHALACAALRPERVTAAVSVSGLAPHRAPGLDWFARMASGGEASLRAAAAGRTVKERHEAEPHAGDDVAFTAADIVALSGPWSWFEQVVGPALAAGPAALIDDDLAFVAPWGFDPADAAVPALIVHGGDDRVVPAAHGAWLARTWPGAELRVFPRDGHISVLAKAGTEALEWLRAHGAD